MATTLNAGGVSSRRGISVPVTAGNAVAGFIGPLNAGDRIRSVSIAGRPADPTGCSMVLGMIGGPATDFTAATLFHQQSSMPVAVGVNVPFPIPLDAIVDESARYFGVKFDHSGSGDGSTYSVWLDVERSFGG